MTHISETTTHLLILRPELDGPLNEWMAEQRDPSLTKSSVINMAIHDWLAARGRLDLPGPQQIDADMLKLLEQAYPDGTPRE